MLLTSFDPFAEFDRLAQRTFGGTDPRRPQATMRMDAIRRADDVELRFDLPGIDPATIEVTVSAKRSEEYAEGEKPFIRERVMGSFSRRIRLSDTADAESIEAGFDAGVLTVRIPVQEKALPRKVEVRTAAAAEITA